MSISYFSKQYQAVPALMQLQKALDGVFVSDRPSTIRAVKKSYPGVPTALLNERFRSFGNGHRALSAAQVIVTGSPYRSVLKHYAAKSYMVFHGTFAFLTPHDVQRDLAHFDKICAIGPRMMRVLAQSGIDVEIQESGYLPFLEYPERNVSAKKVALEAIGFDAAKKTVLYLPSGTPHGSFDLMMPKLLEETQHNEFNLIIRPHPSQSVKLHLRDRIRFFRIKQQIAKLPNVFLDLNYFKISNLLSYADLVMSDGNSTCEESLFYDLPQLLVETNRFSKSTLTELMKSNGASDEDILLSLNLFENGIRVTPAERSMTNAIYRAMADAPNYAVARNYYFEFVFGARGFSRQHKLIEDMQQFRC